MEEWKWMIRHGKLSTDFGVSRGQRDAHGLILFPGRKSRGATGDSWC